MKQLEAAVSTAISELTAPSHPAKPATKANIVIQVDAKNGNHPISPLVYGVSGAPVEVLQALRPTLNSWGGNPSTRFNWQIGHAWNAGKDWFYRNGNYGIQQGSASDNFISEATDAGVVVRLALPTLGWVAKDDHNDTCSFPLPGGGCGDGNGSTCDNHREVADPRQANVPSDPAIITEWMKHLFEEKDFDIRFLAMDNEPELWGFTHYDVHPTCTTYTEILEKYLLYAQSVRAVAPQVELTGPVTCCWYYYWNSAAGLVDKVKNGNRDFLPWFLDEVRKHDEKTGQHSIDVLDIHYYPEGLYNQKTDPETASHRLRSTRSLWDRSYTDESWISEPIFLIPRMQELITEYYPGLRMGISEWNWGADQDINGALAIADVLGIFGRENLYFAAYWTYPPLDSPGFYAFKMYTNYNNLGGRFGGADGGISIQASSNDPEQVIGYAAMGSLGDRLYLMLINKNPETEINAQIDLNGFQYKSQVDIFRYGAEHPEGIMPGTATIRPDDLRLALPAYSITLLIFDSVD